MVFIDTRQRYRVMAVLIALHVAIIAVSNYLVQFPLTLLGLVSTWGAFTFPFIYMITDLTVRLFGAILARRIVFAVMGPALVVSYLLSVLFVHGGFAGWQALATPNIIVARIALASFSAYLLGQVLDITVFNRLRRLKRWWIAPAASSIFGNLLDTLVFFSIAFADSGNKFMASHWPELAATDYSFKLLMSIGVFVPIYGALLGWLSAHMLMLTGARADRAQRLRAGL